MHLLGNMWFLWLFGNNVEDSMGRLRFVVFYLVSGLAAALGQVVTNPNSAIPMVGASGAISGVMGGEVGGVAFWAHVGGFVAGVVLVKLFARPESVAAHQAHHWRPRRVLRDF
jgi:membrane associated rhomboid family serine protease